MDYIGGRASDYFGGGAGLVDYIGGGASGLLWGWGYYGQKAFGLRCSRLVKRFVRSLGACNVLTEWNAGCFIHCLKVMPSEANPPVLHWS